MSFLLAFLGFAALIILHELGHFTAAKAVGMRVERFSLFFPPLIARHRRGDTEYAIGAIPLGGYVKITGMNPAEEIPPAVAHQAYYRQPVWKRIVVIGAGPAVNIVLAFVILWILIWANGVGEPTNRIERINAPPALGVLALGDRIVEVDGVRGDFETLKERAEALYVCPDPLVLANRIRISTLAQSARLPTMHGVREMVDAGGLISYGPNLPDLFHRAAEYVDKILRGAKPADLPVEQPTKFDLIINLTTAKALGVAVPPALLTRADEVIE